MGKVIASDGKTVLEPGMTVIVRRYASCVWKVDIFSHKGSGYMYECANANVDYCLPLKGHEHLVGTTDDPVSAKKRYPQWGDKVRVWEEGVSYEALFVGESRRDPQGVKVLRKGHVTVELFKDYDLEV